MRFDRLKHLKDSLPLTIISPVSKGTSIHYMIEQEILFNFNFWILINDWLSSSNLFSFGRSRLMISLKKLLWNVMLFVYKKDLSEKTMETNLGRSIL